MLEMNLFIQAPRHFSAMISDSTLLIGSSVEKEVLVHRGPPSYASACFFELRNVPLVDHLVVTSPCLRLRDGFFSFAPHDGNIVPVVQSGVGFEEASCKAVRRKERQVRDRRV